MQQLTPKQIVTELDRFIIGQAEAKRAVAVAIRNRWRRQQLDAEFAKEVNPKNIIMVGPTGVGKTEIARRIATLTGAPFIKIEATKFTEVGYHGRDVESMIRDLVEHAIGIIREEHGQTVRDKARDAVEDRLLDKLLPAHQTAPDTQTGGWVSDEQSLERRQSAREKLRDKLLAGDLDDREIEIEVSQKAVPVAMFSNMGLDQMDPDMSKMFENLIPDRAKSRRVTIRQARDILLQEEIEKRIDRDKIASQAIERTEQTGIVFLDEIDKIATGGESGGGRGPDVSRQGVQRDLLPIVEGTSVTTRHGMVQTDHILFIAAGAFSQNSPSDLMPELQGRFPIRVELQGLTRDDFIRILTEPGNALTKQQQALLQTEGLAVTFAEGSIEAMAELAALVNANNENIGARRLMTIMEKLFEQISFDAPEMVASGQTEISITAQMVQDRLSDIAANEDLSKFVL